MFFFFLLIVFRIILFILGIYVDFYYYGEGVIYEFYLCCNDNEFGN